VDVSDLAVIVIVTTLSPPLYIIQTFVMSKGSCQQLLLFLRMFVAPADRWTCGYSRYALCSEEGNNRQEMKDPGECRLTIGKGEL
jgi:hypothetical protein